jgi:broad specificity phosphatase PhoE
MVVGVRHAAVWNPEGVVYARLPGFHLSESGRAEAEQLSRDLSSVGVASIQASPLERAVETARILAEPHGLDVVLDERLLEWSFWSHWEGLPWTGIRERDPELLEGYASDPASAWPQDPLEAAAERVLAWAADAERAFPDGLVLGVTHEAPLLAAYLLGSGRSLATYHATNLPHLGTVRLRPGPAEIVDLQEWAARSC